VFWQGGETIRSLLGFLLFWLVGLDFALAWLITPVCSPRKQILAFPTRIELVFYALKKHGKPFLVFLCRDVVIYFIRTTSISVGCVNMERAVMKHLKLAWNWLIDLL
jgi:hypothetical protein